MNSTTGLLTCSSPLLTFLNATCTHHFFLFLLFISLSKLAWLFYRHWFFCSHYENTTLVNSKPKPQEKNQSINSTWLLCAPPHQQLHTLFVHFACISKLNCTYTTTAGAQNDCLLHFISGAYIYIEFIMQSSQINENAARKVAW